MTEKSGIYSLAGFAFQIKIFILQIVKMRNDCKIEYETIDDIAINIAGKRIDDYEAKLYTIINSGIRTAIQVKRTRVGKEEAKKIMINWILVNYHNDVDEFVLVTDRDINKNIFHEINIDEICSSILSEKREKSLVAKVKKIGYSEKELKEQIRNIISKVSVHIRKNVDKDIYDEFEDYFLKIAVKEPTYCLRIKQMIEQVTCSVIDAISKGEPYVLTYEEACCMKNRIIENNTDEKWNPSYAQFKKINTYDEKDLARLRPREYDQLNKCEGLSLTDIFRHLHYEEYYINCKRAYYERGMQSIVDDMEITAFDNFCDVKSELKNIDNDTPYNRLKETKEKSNNKAVDNQIKYGVCINLTGENIDKSQQISWKDD